MIQQAVHYYMFTIYGTNTVRIVPPFFKFCRYFMPFFRGGWDFWIQRSNMWRPTLFVQQSWTMLHSFKQAVSEFSFDYQRNFFKKPSASINDFLTTKTRLFMQPKTRFANAFKCPLIHANSFCAFIK